ncbi:MAG TPA: hypothetical protein VG013_00930 [Gemmataceae bacterium]|jgi:hypothetical protein|nr:hypothetical protein [Gemmataceae bacterium]
MSDSAAKLPAAVTDVREESLACSESPAYFVDNYVSIYDPAGDWVPFRLWPAQIQALDVVTENQLVIILKARQLGMTWLALGYALWQMIFRPAATVLIFSRREEESTYLLGEERLRGMYRRLPAWLRVPSVEPDAAKTWTLSTGSVARAFPTNAGDSYTATLAIVDEADLVTDLDKLMRSVKPTIDHGGQMVLLSRPNKSKPESEFKKIYRAAKSRLNGWRSIFLPWNARPDRNAAWYEAQKRDILCRTGSDDDLHEQYPASDVEALAPRTLDKRIAAHWLQQCYLEQAPLSLPPEAPSLPGLTVYAVPRFDRRYVIGADPAEGNPTSDDSALEILDIDTGEEVATLAGKLQPTALASYADQLGRWYWNAAIMCERNNHGHAVLAWLREHSALRCLYGHDRKPGWLSSTLGKAQLYDATADAFRNKEVILHHFPTFTQLASIDGSTLRAPEGESDDLADAFAMACVGMAQARRHRDDYLAEPMGFGLPRQPY